MKRAIIWGYGDVIFPNFINQLISKYRIVAIADRKFQQPDFLSMNEFNIPMIHPSDINDYEFDTVIILSRYFAEITKELIELLSVHPSKINYEYMRDFISCNDIAICSRGGVIVERCQVSILCEAAQDEDIFRSTFNGMVHSLILSDCEYVVIDAGLNIGCTSLWYANMLEVSMVYSYEPFESTYQKAINNIKRNQKLLPKIKPFNAGLGFGYAQKMVEVITTESKGLNSILGEQNFKTHIDSREKLLNNVEVEIMDSGEEIYRIHKLHPTSRILMKIDTEGSEYEIFDSLIAKNVLHLIDIFVIETHVVRSRNREEILKALKPTYTIHMIKENNHFGTSEFIAIRNAK